MEWPVLCDNCGRVVDCFPGNDPRDVEWARERHIPVYCSQCVLSRDLFQQNLAREHFDALARSRWLLDGPYYAVQHRVGIAAAAKVHLRACRLRKVLRRHIRGAGDVEAAVRTFQDVLNGYAKQLVRREQKRRERHEHGHSEGAVEAAQCAAPHA